MVRYQFPISPPLVGVFLWPKFHHSISNISRDGGENVIFVCISKTKQSTAHVHTRLFPVNVHFFSILVYYFSFYCTADLPAELLRDAFVINKSVSSFYLILRLLLS